jgi:hypothetical protein
MSILIVDPSTPNSCAIQAYLFTIGKLKANVAPLPSELFSAHILPPCASTMLFDMNNPSPVPPASDFVANFVKSFGSISESIPFT